MRISIQATIGNEDGSSSQVIQVGEITREAGVDPASGLGLFVREANALLQQIQSVVLNEQADEFIRVAAGCLACGRRLGIKDTKPLVYRTVYGKARLHSPRYYSRCTGCGFVSGDGSTVSPLAHALRERTHPQWTWFLLSSANPASGINGYCERRPETRRRECGVFATPAPLSIQGTLRASRPFQESVRLSPFFEVSTPRAGRHCGFSKALDSSSPPGEAGRGTGTPELQLRFRSRSHTLLVAGKPS